MRVRLAGMIALLGIPVAAPAAELQSGISSEGYWTDNVYSQSIEEVDDFSVRVSPWGEVMDDEGDVTWGLRYQPAYEYWLDEDDVRGFDHDVAARVGWRLTPRTTLRFGDRFQRFHSLSRFNELAEPGQDVVVAGRRVEYKTNSVNGGLEHWFDPRNLIVFNTSYTFQNFSERGQLDRDFYGTSLVYRHRWSERATLGAAASWSRQSVESLAEDVDDRETDYYNLSALFLYALSPTLTLEASAGPALIQSNVDDFSAPAGGFDNRQEFPRFSAGGGQQFLVDADTCPRNNAGDRFISSRCQIITPAIGQFQLDTVDDEIDGVPLIGEVPAADDSNLTYFADIALIKQWERFRGELSYTRSEDRSTGFGAVSDIFYGSLRWQATRRISAKLIGSYEIREQESEQVVFVPLVTNELTGLAAPPLNLAARTFGMGAELVDSSSGLDVIVGSLQISYDLTPRSSLYTIMVYRDEQSDGEVFVERDMQRFSVTVGINYIFDPIDLF